MCALRVRRIHKSYIWPHIASLNVYPFTNTASRMLNIFCTKGFTNAKKDQITKRQTQNMFTRRRNQVDIMCFLSLIVKTKQKNKIWGYTSNYQNVLISQKMGKKKCVDGLYWFCSVLSEPSRDFSGNCTKYSPNAVNRNVSKPCKTLCIPIAQQSRSFTYTHREHGGIPNVCHGRKDCCNCSSHY